MMQGCKKSPGASNEQQLYFQLDYLNYAWGYQHTGYIIDGNGNVLVYDNPEKWNFPDDTFTLTADQVAENITLCRKSGISVSREELIKYASHIGNIAASKVTALRNVGADAGSVQFICYEVKGSGVYKGTLIKLEGDFTCENLNFFSKKIVSWMKEINGRLSRN
jgi:hypothetical protein